jgi:hypothetical protein
MMIFANVSTITPEYLEMVTRALHGVTDISKQIADWRAQQLTSLANQRMAALVARRVLLLIITLIHLIFAIRAISKST